MNYNHITLEILKDYAFIVIESIKSDKDYQDSDVLKDYAVLYLNFINSLENNNDIYSKQKFTRIESLSRAYLEVDSDWSKPFLEKMYEFEKLGRKYYSL